MIRSLSVVLPAYNESVVLGGLVREIATVLQTKAWCYELIIVDDGSTDETDSVTSALVRTVPNVRVIRHSSNRGYGCAIRAGISAASCEWTILMDADGQFPPIELTAMLGAMSSCDCVLGVRIQRKDSFFRRALGRFGNSILKRILKAPILDVNCGLKLFRTCDLKAMDLRSTGGLISTEILFNFLRQERIIRQVTVAHEYRRHGIATGAQLRVLIGIVREGIQMLCAATYPKSSITS
jgi:dolichol-phosphate mannosyltransferase